MEHIVHYSGADVLYVCHMYYVRILCIDTNRVPMNNINKCSGGDAHKVALEQHFALILLIAHKHR